MSKEKYQRVLKYRSEVKSIPRRYKENVMKEELAIAYAYEQYNKQYTNLFPTQPELLLSPMNEFGQKKFISTFITPTLLPYDEIYDYKECSKFIADHITYEQVTKDFKKIPDLISTPTMTLETQKGDCFDISIILASLLIGAGYNAYCVVGYAKREFTINNTRLRDFDIKKLLHTEEKVQKKCDSKKERKYKTKEKVHLVSKYLKQKKAYGEDVSTKKKEEEELEEEEEEGEGEFDDEEEDEEEEDEEEVDEESIFCWVVVLPKSRGIEKPMNINPSNGEVSSVEDPNYIQSLTVFNHENYWVNMHEEHGNYDLSRENWECIFLGEEEEFTENKENEIEVLDLPMSFCFPLQISKERFLTRFPNSTKTVEHRNVMIRRSAPFFEKDLSVLDVFVYGSQEEEEKKVVERHLVFKKRKDKLTKRSEYFDCDGKRTKLVESFSPGRKYSSTRMEGLKQITHIEKKMKEYIFYPKARLDGLSMIRKYYKDDDDPEFARKIAFSFCERDDFLRYRDVSYQKKKEEGEEESRIVVLKKSEKFERDPSKNSDENISKLVYFHDRTKVIYHFGRNRITRSSKEYSKDGEVAVNLVDHYAVKPTRDETLKEFEELFKMDKRCSDEISRVLEELKDILEIRKGEESSIQFETSIYDYLQNQPDENRDDNKKRKDSSGGIESGRKKKNDILSLYIPENGIKDREQAIQIFDEIMERTKDRLSIRAQIIQDRLKAEKSLMNKKRLQIQKQDNENSKKEEQFLKFWEETIFKTKILQERCDKNIKESEDHYLKTQMSLLHDDRIKKFFEDEVDIHLKEFKDVV